MRRGIGNGVGTVMGWGVLMGRIRGVKGWGVIE